MFGLLGNDNPKKILIEELRKSNSFFQLLSNTLKDDTFNQSVKESIQNIENMIFYIQKSNIIELEDLIEKVNKFRKLNI